MRHLSLWPNQKGLARDFWRQFDDLFQSVAAPEWPKELEAFAPSLDIEEHDKDYLIKVDIPGVSRDDIKVEVKDNTLFVTGERKRETKTDGEFVRYERVFGRFERALSLPRNVESDKISAKYEDGVLALTIPKSAASTTKVIEVKKS